MGYCSLLEIEDSQRAGIELFAPVPDKSESKKAPTRSGLPQLGAREFHWDATTASLSCPAGHGMRQVSRSKDPRSDNRYVVELRFEQNESTCSQCPLASQCLSIESKRRTVRRLEKQELITQQIAKMATAAGLSSSLQRKIQVERRFADSKRNRGGTAFHGRSLSRVTAETGLMVVAQNSLTIYII